MRTKKEWVTMIEELLGDDLYRPLFPMQLQGLLQTEENELEAFSQALTELERTGRLLYTAKGKCAPPRLMGYVTGVLQKHPKGFGFVAVPDTDEKDIFIPETCMAGAMHKDLVAVKIRRRGRHRAEGEIVQILQRNTKELVCTYYKKKYGDIAVPENGKDKEIRIGKGQSLNAVHGDKVMVDPGRNCVTEVLGHKGEPGIEILALLREQGFFDGFPEDVLQEANRIPQILTEQDLKGRRDFRDQMVFTIDGEDTKDIDDAISLELTDSGNFLLGVHIADVTHYVKEGSALDRSAYDRGTSVYPVDRVSPMLPKALSNGICSLNPHTDRLTLSVLMEIDSTGNTVSHEIVKGVIRSREQMTYTAVYQMLEEGDRSLCQRYQDLLPVLRRMQELTLILRKKRLERGAIDLDIPEAKVILDEKGRPVEINRRTITIANQMIEEMMLVCNETVAEHFYWLDIPFLYRIHQIPEADKMQRFREFVRILGYRLKGSGQIHSRELQTLLDKTKGKQEERVISSAMLRSLQKACYTPDVQGHFGLGARYYCHFTSPIRRYPDLLIHRIIKETLEGQMGEQRQADYRTRLQEIADHCSERERAAERVERDSVKLKMAEYMSHHLGETFSCIVSGVTNFGLFVETENLIEGLISVEDLTDDIYRYDEKQYALYGKYTGKRYRIGDSVEAQVVRTDTQRKIIEFVADIW